MAHNIFQFMQKKRVEARKKDIAIRMIEFTEIYKGFNKQEAKSQAERCLSCANPYCEWKCPVHNFIPDWLRLVQEDRIIEAVELCHQTSSLPEVCGRVCPQDRLCESACTLNEEKFGAVTIGNIERYITDKAFAMGWRPSINNTLKSNKRVAIIGAGPAGIGCADVLIRNGVKSVIFDRHPEIGGLLTYGIPSFKLDKNVMINRRKIFSEMGIEFRFNQEVGKDIQIESILKEFDAVFLGVGTYKSIQAAIPNENADGVYSALPFLIGNTKHILKNPPTNTPYISMQGKNVIVLGGGDTAMDCVRTSIRQQAKNVICAYRRDEVNMPGSKKEVKNAKEEGAKFLFNVQPIKIMTNKKNQVTGIKFVKTKMEKNAENSGRQRSVIIEGSEFIQPADAILVAFGFQPHPLPWLKNTSVKLDNGGRIIAPADGKFAYQTDNPKIFAGGDIVRGSDLVVTAMYEGRTAAEGILDYLDICDSRLNNTLLDSVI